MCAAEAQAIAGKTIQTLNDMRTDDMFDLFWNNMECLRMCTDNEESLLPGERRSPKHLEIREGEC